MNNGNGLGAIVLAAGLSTRMGHPKLLLPWGETNVIGQVIAVLIACEIQPMVIVTGKTHEDIQKQFGRGNIHLAYNPDFDDGRMLKSLKTGLKKMTELGASATLLALGDQPQILPETIRAVMAAQMANQKLLIIPSHQIRRGHPWGIPRLFWEEIIHLPNDLTMRDFINSHRSDIQYVNVDSASILSDLDTPEDYQREKPRPKE